jgi:hypothetical protein
MCGDGKFLETNHWRNWMLNTKQASCEIDLCQTRSSEVFKSTEVIDNQPVEVWLCRSCFELFGEELPEPKRIKQRIEERDVLYVKQPPAAEKIGGFRI